MTCKNLIIFLKERGFHSPFCPPVSWPSQRWANALGLCHWAVQGLHTEPVPFPRLHLLPPTNSLVLGPLPWAPNGLASPSKVSETQKAMSKANPPHSPSSSTVEAVKILQMLQWPLPQSTCKASPASFTHHAGLWGRKSKNSFPRGERMSPPSLGKQQLLEVAPAATASPTALSPGTARVRMASLQV